jgi:hypothetical protein
MPKNSLLSGFLVGICGVSSKLPLGLAQNAAVHTADRDLMRFKGLKCTYPLDSLR